MIQSIFQSTSYNEIIFNGRNKLYGAYLLRRSYNKHLLASFLFVVFVCTVIFIGSLFTANNNLVPSKTILNIIELTKVDLPQIKLKEHVKLTKTVKNNLASKTMVIKKDDENKVKKELDEILKTSIATNNQTVLNGNASNDQIGKKYGELKIGNFKGLSIPEKPKILEFSEIMPEFPGGFEALEHYIQKNLIFPTEAYRKGISGHVVVSFIVDEDGKIADIRLVNDIGYQCGESALTLISKMPKWNAGKQNGKAVPVLIKMPIHFSNE
jgi:protein TonB